MRHVRHTRGFSLIEVLIALAISSLLLVGLVATFSNGNTSYMELTKMSRQIENGRYAMSVLESDLRHAGFWGEYTGGRAVRDPEAPPAPVAPDPCEDGPAEFLANLVIPVYGYDGGAATPLMCLANYKTGTDVLVIRRVSTEPETGALDPKSVYFQGFLDAPIAEKGPYLAYGNAAPFDVTYPAEPTTTMPIRRFVERIYYIAKCHDCAAGDDIPTLIRLDYTGNKAFDTVPLAEGIEDLQIRFGIDDSGLNNGAPTTYKVATGMLPDPDWDSVMVVEVSLLARNNETTRDYVDKKTYRLGDKVVLPSGDGYHRHAFSQVVRLVNPASKKEDFITWQ